MAIERIKILGAVLELPAKHVLPIQPIHCENGPNGLNWQFCLAGSSKVAPTILIFSIAMGTDYSFELISIVHWLPQFFMHNKSIIGRVSVGRSSSNANQHVRKRSIFFPRVHPGNGLKESWQPEEVDDMRGPLCYWTTLFNSRNQLWKISWYYTSIWDTL